MARIINGQYVTNSEEKKKAVEGAGGTFNSIVEGDYVQEARRNQHQGVEDRRCLTTSHSVSTQENPALKNNK